MTNEAGSLYLYAVTRRGGPPLPNGPGVAGARLATVDDEDLSAVVSPFLADRFTARKSDLLAHSDILQELATIRTVLPVRFGVVFADRAELLDRLLRRRRRPLLKLLDELDGKSEIQVRATYVEESVVRELVSGDRQLQRLGRAKPGYTTQVELGRRFATVLAARRDNDAKQVIRPLAKLADRVSLDEPGGEWAALKAAFLVDKKKLPVFTETVGRMETELRDRLTLSWLGPLPPYSFVPNNSLERIG